MPLSIILAETQDAGGKVACSFTIALPTALTKPPPTQLTHGFVARVTYSGNAVFPPHLLVATPVMLAATLSLPMATMFTSLEVIYLYYLNKLI